MPEYEFHLSGRLDLQVPNGRSEPCLLCMSYNQDDHRVADIEGLLAECGGEVTSRSADTGEVFFTPTS